MVGVLNDNAFPTSVRKVTWRTGQKIDCYVCGGRRDISRDRLPKGGRFLRIRRCLSTKSLCGAFSPGPLVPQDMDRGRLRGPPG